MARGGEKGKNWQKFLAQLPRPPLPAAVGIFLLAVLAAFLLRGKEEPSIPLLVATPQELPGWIREELLPVNEWSRPGEAMEAVNGIVIHYVGNPGTTAGQNRDYFAGLAQSHEAYASSNFLVGLEGEVLLCVPIGEVAYCSNDRNIDTLSIEVCHPDDTGAFTPESYASLVKLVNWLRDFYSLEPEDVIRHYDVKGKECPKYYVDHPEAWAAFREELKQAAKNPET